MKELSAYGRAYRVARWRLVWSVLLVALVPVVKAQEADTLRAGRSDAPAVYIDCDRCDMGHIRQSIVFVNYARDPEDADVHVFVTTQRTGSGGVQYKFALTGKRAFTGVDNALVYTSLPTDTYNEEREAVVDRLELALAPYLVRTPLAGRFKVTFDDHDLAAPTPEDDPWDSWVFEVSGSGGWDVEESERAYSLRGDVEAGRTTEDWKFYAELYANVDERRIEDGDTTYTRNQQRNGAQSRLIKSLTRHWSAGVFGDVYSNTYRNQDLGVSFAPALEYNIFPYAESARRQWVVVYRVTAAYTRYIEETIYSRMEETRLRQSLGTHVSLRQPWGYAYAGVEGSHYLHDMSKHAIEVYGNISMRLTRGLSLRFETRVEKINDQIYLPAGEGSLEDRLLQQRQLATAYELSGSVGLTYTFGSAFSNVVNERL